MYSSKDIIDAWKNYGPKRAKYSSLWDGSLACAFGPLGPEGGTLHDQSKRTAGAVWSVGAGDVPKYERGSVKGQAFWAGSSDGLNDGVSFSANFPVGSESRTFTQWVKKTTFTNRPGEYNGYWAVIDYGLYSTHKRSYLGIMSDASYIPAWDRRMVFEIHAVTYASVSTVSLNEWNHVAFCYGGGIVENSGMFWLNGLPAGLVGNTNGITLLTATSTAYTACFMSGQSHEGQWADSRVHRRVLTPSEIATLAIHPLEAYRVEVPRYYHLYGTTAGVKFSPWLRRQRMRMTGT